MSYINNNYFKRGSWNVICDVCGVRHKADQVRKRWDGLMVCAEDWETDHPQKFLRVRSDPKPVPFVRSEPADTFADTRAIAGIAVAGIAIAGVDYYLNGPQNL
jgi:hypothetical protein